jgi:hypothetical protein
MPVIAEAKSYREFMKEVNQQVTAPSKLLLYGSINSDPVIFYRGGPIETLDQPPEELASRMGSGNLFIIMPEQLFGEIQKQRPDLPAPLVKSAGTGPEGDVRLVLVRGRDV